MRRKSGQLSEFALNPRVIWAAGLFAVSFALYLYYGLHPLWDEEAMYAETPREMLVSGDFLHPTLNFAPFLFKPPFYFWANAASQALFGPGEFGVRLPSALFSACTVLLVFGIGSRLSLRAGVFSGAALATFYGFVFHTSTMLTDIPLTMFTAGAVYFFLKSLDGSRWGVYGLYASLAFAVMTKGLVGLVFPGAAFALFILAGRRRDVLKALFSLPGIVLFAAITVPWHFLMEAANPGFLKNYIINEQVLRFINKRFPPDLDSVNTPLFILVTFAWLLPWAVYVFPAVARHMRKDKPRGDTERLALYWAFGGMAFLALSGSKMEYYSLPVLPAFAVLIGSYWAGLGREGGPRTAWCMAGTAFLAVAAILGILAFPHFSGALKGWLELSGREAAGISVVADRTFFMLLTGMSLALYLLYRRWTEAAYAAFFLTALLVSVSARPALDSVARSFSSADAAKAVSTISKPRDLVVVDGGTEYEFCATYNYYTGRKVFILENMGMPVLPVKFDAADRFLLRDEEFRTLWNSGRKVFLATSRDPAGGGITGLPAGDFKKVFDGSRAVYANLMTDNEKTCMTTTGTTTSGGFYAGKGTVVRFSDVQRKREYREDGGSRPRNGEEGCARL